MKFNEVGKHLAASQNLQRGYGHDKIIYKRKIYIIDHHHWAAVVSRGWAKLACLVLSSVRLWRSRSSLHRLAGLPCRLFLSYGFQVVDTRGRSVDFEAVDDFMCPAWDGESTGHLIFRGEWKLDSPTPNKEKAE